VEKRNSELDCDGQTVRKEDEGIEEVKPSVWHGERDFDLLRGNKRVWLFGW